MECKICSRNFKGVAGITKHVMQKHKMSTEDYFIQYIGEVSNCQTCAGKTLFISIGDGYRKYCSHTCSGVGFRKELMADAERSAKFVQKVKDNQSRIWKERKGTVELSIISEKISKTLKSNNSSLTESERKIKFGWMNNIPKEERYDYYSRSLLSWWKNSSDGEKQIVYDARLSSGVKNGTMTPLEDSDEFIKYKNSARRLSNKNYAKHKSIINPENIKRSRKYHLDHIVSIFDCFQNNVPMHIAASVVNLRIVDAFYNLSKNRKSDMTVQELMEMYNGKTL